MSLTNSLRATALATLIAIGSTVSSEASTAQNTFLSAVQALILESAAVVSNVARHGIDALGLLRGSP
jgi:hypothetical protein